MRLREGADGGAGGGEAVATGGREVLQQAERIDGIDVVGDDGGGRAAGEDFADEGDEAADQRGVGVAAETADAVAEFTDEPDDGDAAAHAVGIVAEVGGERRIFFRAVDEEREAFVRIVDIGVFLDEGGELGGRRRRHDRHRAGASARGKSGETPGSEGAVGPGTPKKRAGG